MKVKELIDILSKENYESEVLIRDSGSILSVAPAWVMKEYNDESWGPGKNRPEFFIVVGEWEDEFGSEPNANWR